MPAMSMPRTMVMAGTRRENRRSGAAKANGGPVSFEIRLQTTTTAKTYMAMMTTTTEPIVYSVARTSWVCLVA